MSLFSAIFGGPKKKDPEQMRKIAQSRSTLGSLTGTSPYMREWRTQNKDLHKEYVERERSMRKKWGYEDIELNRALQKERDRYYRKYKDPNEAAKWFAKYEAKFRRDIQRERDHQLRDMKYEKNDRQRGIAKEIKQWK